MSRIALTTWVQILAAGSALRRSPPSYDIVSRNGRLVDGLGNPWVKADDMMDQSEAVLLKSGLRENELREGATTAIRARAAHQCRAQPNRAMGLYFMMSEP